MQPNLSKVKVKKQHQKPSVNARTNIQSTNVLSEHQLLLSFEAKAVAWVDSFISPSATLVSPSERQSLIRSKFLEFQSLSTTSSSPSTPCSSSSVAPDSNLLLDADNKISDHSSPPLSRCERLLLALRI